MKTQQHTTPVPADAGNAAPLGARIGAQTLFEVRSILSNGEQLILSLVFPLALLFGLSQTEVLSVFGYTNHEYPYVAVATAAALSLSIVSAAFTGQAIQTSFDRRGGVLRQLATTPLGTSGLVIAKILAVYVVIAIQFAMVFIAAEFLDLNISVSVPGLLLAGVLGTASLVTWALLIAGTIRFEAVLALTNLLWALSAGVGGIVVPHPGLWGATASVLPFGALGDAMRAAVLDGAVSWRALLILAVWTALGVLANKRWFSFDAK